MKPPSIKIVSGGQTGADRAAADFAIENSIPYGGWIPLGRLAEDGSVPSSYIGFSETNSSDYSERTRLNVMDSDGTLIISHGPLTGGSRLTAEVADEISRPYLHVDLSKSDLKGASRSVTEWLGKHRIETLNIAGPRNGEDPLIYSKTKELLTLLFD